MTLIDVLLIAAGLWLVLIIVAEIVNGIRRGIDNQRRIGCTRRAKREDEVVAGLNAVYDVAPSGAWTRRESGE